jgi:hypothetical protein
MVAEMQFQSVEQAECGEETVLVEDENSAVLEEEKVAAAAAPVVADTAPVATTDPDAPKEATEASVFVEDPVEDGKETVEPDQSQAVANKQPFERDFDADPTDLYVMIQKKAWKETVKQAQESPEEARIWVSRNEKDGRLRWRLLPIHAAIIFKAPEDVVEALLAAYPKGAQSKDDQGMLALHLAFRNGSTEGVVNLLLVAYPQSIDVKDRKGRIPLVLAQASTSPNRDAFMRALERGPTYYAVAAAATERAAVTAEQRAIFDAKLMQVRQAHQHEITQLNIAATEQQSALQDKLAAMEKELLKTQETSQVLVDHVNSLEAQLSSRSDTERFLATKIAALDSSLKDTYRTREEIEQGLKTENCQLTIERDSYKTKFEQMEIQHNANQQRLEQALDLREKRQRECDQTERRLTQQCKSTELDWANAQANCAILDAQLKRKMETEHALATQVSALASKLAESAFESRDASKSFNSRIHILEGERKVLRESVQDLAKRLSTVARALEEMTKQQQSIFQEAETHEEEMANASAAYAKIVADAMRQEALLVQAKVEREHMRALLAKQESDLEQGRDEQTFIMNAIAVQGKHMEKTKKTRDDIVCNVESLGAEINGVLNNVLNVIPANAANDDALVDAVLKAISSGPSSEELEPKLAEARMMTPEKPTKSKFSVTPRSMQEHNQEHSPIATGGDNEAGASTSDFQIPQNMLSADAEETQDEATSLPSSSLSKPTDDEHTILTETTSKEGTEATSSRSIDESNTQPMDDVATVNSSKSEPEGSKHAEEEKSMSATGDIERPSDRIEAARYAM